MIYILIAIALTLIFIPWRSRKTLRQPQPPYKVLRHIDGDTTDFLDVRNNKTLRVRYLVIDANERRQPGGAEATKYLTQLLPIGSRVHIDFTGNKSHDRWEGTIYHNGKNINLEMLRGGHAVIDERYLGRISPEMRVSYRAALSYAQSRKLGRWSKRSRQQQPKDFRSRK